MKIPKTIGQFLYWKEQQWRGRGNVRNYFELLKNTQWLSPQEIRTLQFEKLRQIVTHAYDTVPYYKRAMQERGIKPQDINSFADMRKLPMLTRDLLRLEQDNLVSRSADFATLTDNYSSGSTGVRAQFKQDANFRMWMRAHQLRTYGWCSNWELGEPFVLLWGSEIYWNSKQFVDNIENFLTNRREFNTFCLSNDLIKRFLKQLVDFKPVLVSTYPNAMHLIAKEAEREQVKIKGLRCIQGTSEPMPPIVRKRIASVFDCELYDKYGMRETNIVCHESPNHEEMCIQAENVFVEFINDEGEPCRDYEIGKLVITTLNNWSMPLIRYETTDLAAPVSGYCSSGIGLPRMTAVLGRLQDLIITPAGDRIDAYFFSYLFMRFPEIHWFQVIQREVESLQIRLCAPSGLSRLSREALIERIHHHTKFPFRIEFEMLSQMPDSSTGKFRLTVSELREKSVAVGRI